MKYVKIILPAFAVLLIAVILIGCGNPTGGGSSSGGGTSNTTGPAVLSVSPANGSTDVAANINITATFNVSMDASTITPETFTLITKEGSVGLPVLGVVTYEGLVATLEPTSILEPGTTYEVTIATSVRDLSGEALAAKKTWSFTTAYPWVDYTANPLFGDSTNHAYYPSAVKVGSTYHIWYGDGNTTRHATSTSADFSGIVTPAPEITVGGIPISSVLSVHYHPNVLYRASGWTVNGTTTSDVFLMYSAPGSGGLVSVLLSADGNEWTNLGTCEGINDSSSDQGSIVYNFSVLFEGGTVWKGYTDSGQGRIEYYTSTDGFNWTSEATNILANSWGSWKAQLKVALLPRSSSREENIISTTAAERPIIIRGSVKRFPPTVRISSRHLTTPSSRLMTGSAGETTGLTLPR